MEENFPYQTLRQEIYGLIISHKKEIRFKKGDEFGKLVKELVVSVDLGQIITEDTNGVSFSGSASISFDSIDDDPNNRASCESIFHFSGTAQVEKLHVVKVNEPITITY